LNWERPSRELQILRNLTVETFLLSLAHAVMTNTIRPLCMITAAEQIMNKAQMKHNKALLPRWKQTWRGREILGTSCCCFAISAHWATQPTVRATANSTVYIDTGICMANASL
jgi:hypothetical protein